MRGVQVPTAVATRIIGLERIAKSDDERWRGAL